MSRFFHGGASSSESDSDYSSSEDERSASDVSASESESDASENESGSEDERPKKSGAAGGASRFMRGFAGSDSDEDSDEDVKRVVKSARDKRFDEMRSIVKSLKNAQKINDWVAIQNEFEKLNKAYSKAGSIIQREGIPRFYTRTLAGLEDFQKETLSNKDAVKKMNASSSRALNAMKQKLKKHNKQFEANIEKFRANPVDEEESAEEAERKAQAESSDEDSDDETKSGRNKWTKVTKEEGDDFAKVEKKKGTKKTQEAEPQAEGAGDFQVVGKGGKVFDVKPENLFKKLGEIIEARGRKSTDRQLQMQHLELLLGIAVTAYQKVKVLLALIPSRFDSAPTPTGYMPIDVWKKASEELNQLFGTLEEFPNIRIVELEQEEDEETAAEEKFKNGDTVTIRGSLGSLIDRIDDEFTKSLQHIDPHTLDYINRLRDETVLYALIVRAQKYFERIDFALALDHIKMRRVEHLYYKPDVVIQAVEKEVRNLYPSLNEALEDPVELVEHLCTSLYKTSIDRVRTRALLCHVYHLALHDKFQRARDMMLMSHLQDHIQQMEVFTQILFNRTMVQIGLCAFRKGMIKETANALQEISSSGKVKELLAQGVQMQRYSEKTPEQEKLEKQRQLPFHMHINLELLECVYLTVSMLLEVPNMAQNVFERRKVISKVFRRMLDYSERQVFGGPPENTRDHIMTAAKALTAGEWERCRDLIHAISIWDLMPNSAEIKSMLTAKIQKEGLRTYLFTYSTYYDSLGITQLSEMFGTTPGNVRAIVSRMIINEELFASIDQREGVIVLHKQGTDTSRLEYLAGVYAEKVGSLVESNEKLLEARSLVLGLQGGRERFGEQRGAGGKERRDGGAYHKGADRRQTGRQGGYGGDRNRSGRGRAQARAGR